VKGAAGQQGHRRPGGRILKVVETKEDEQINLHNRKLK